MDGMGLEQRPCPYVAGAGAQRIEVTGVEEDWVPQATPVNWCDDGVSALAPSCDQSADHFMVQPRHVCEHDQGGIYAIDRLCSYGQ